MFTYPYQIIKRKLQTGVTELRDIDWYTGQDSIADKKAAIFTAPGAYIAFVPNQPRTMGGQKVQSALTQFDLILLTDCVLDGDKRVKKDNPQDHMRIFDKIYKSLQGFSAKISYLPEFVALLNSDQDQRMFNSLDRVGITPPHLPRKALMKSVQRFSGVFFDHGAAMQYTTPATSPTLQVTSHVSLPTP